MHKLLKSELSPLVLAGVEYLFAICREANSCSPLLENGARGNPDDLSACEFHQRAWPIVQPHFTAARKKGAERHRQLCGAEKASNDMRVVGPAWDSGQVGLLFSALDAEVWGIFAPQSNALHVHSEPRPGDEDLLDLAATQTVLHRGTVYAAKREEIPDGGPVAAVFR